MDVLVDRCAGLDVHKDTVMAVVRRPAGNGSGREQEVRQYRTFTAALRELRAWLVAERVTQVAMEATGSYWKPVWHVLEAEDGYELLLCNAQHVKNVRGRKTDVSDAAWLAQLAECGLLRGSFVPTPTMARLRDLTRYAKKLTAERTREIQRVGAGARRRRDQVGLGRLRRPRQGRPGHARGIDRRRTRPRRTRRPRPDPDAAQDPRAPP